jgi:hypothetical protein
MIHKHQFIISREILEEYFLAHGISMPENSEASIAIRKDGVIVARVPLGPAQLIVDVHHEVEDMLPLRLMRADE